MKLFSILIPAICGLMLLSPQSYAQPVFDEEFSCTSSQKAEQYVRDFNINVRSFGGMELCDAKVDTKKLFNDLLIVEEGRFAPQASHALIGNFVDSNRYYPWLKAQTEGMNRGNDVPWATAYNSMGYFTMQDGWAGLSTLGRVGVVVHEARHTEGYRHIPCNFGPYAGSSLPGCDGRFLEGGSHGVEMEYYARVVVYGENFHPLYKKMARLMALGRSNFVFNQKVIQPREALFLIRKDGTEARLIDGGRGFRREVSGSGFLKRSSYGPVLFTPDQAFSLDAYDWLGDTRPTADGYSYFKLLTLPKGQPSGQPPKDLEELDIGNKRLLASIDYQDRFGFYNFSKGAWGNFRPIPGKPLGIKTQYKDKQGLFIVLDNFKIIQSLPEQDRLVETTMVWDANDVSYMMGPNREVLQLKADGTVRTLDGNLWIPTQDALWGQAVNIPLYNGFDVR
ncbi:MAG: hypothetical protein RJB66_913 [Pseudomonadota bacterium]|jgi:hypothetical protein